MVTKRAAATEKENDVVARKSKKRSRAVVTPPPGQSSSASGGVDNTQVEGKPPVASSSPPLIDIITIKTPPSASAPSQVASSPPLVHTSTVAAATAVSTVPMETNITSTTDGYSLVDKEQTRQYAEARAYAYSEVTTSAWLTRKESKKKAALKKKDALKKKAALKKKVAPKKKAASKTKHQLTRNESEEEALVKRKKHYFERQFGVAFKPKKEIKNNTVIVIPESHPKAIAKASKTNTTTSLTIAPAEHDHYCRQVGGTLPITEEVHQALTTGHGIGLVTTWWNYYHGINPENFHTLREVSSHLPPNLAGGIHRWGLVPLQSILKESKKENVWMGGLHSLDWMIGYVKKNHQEELQKCGNKIVCIIIPSGDQRLNLFHRFTAPGPYTDYVNPVISPFIVPVSAKDTVELNAANAIPRCIANAPQHPSVVPLLTEEEKQNRKLAYDRSYYREHIEERKLYYQSYYREHKEAYQSYQRSYRREHIEEKRLYDRARYQSKKNRNV